MILLCQVADPLYLYIASEWPPNRGAAFRGHSDETTAKFGSLFKTLARCLIILTLAVALINYSKLVMV